MSSAPRSYANAAGGRGGGRGGAGAGRGGAAAAGRSRILTSAYPAPDDSDSEGELKDGGLNRSASGARAAFELLAYVFIGDASTATSEQLMKNKGITEVINCAKEEVPEFQLKDKFTYHELDATDEDDCELSNYFDTVFDIIWKVKESNGKVMLYDETGKNLAPALAVAYMMKASKKQEKHLPLKKALEYLAAKIPGSDLSDVFKLHLADLEFQLYEENSINIRSLAGGAGGRGGRGGKGGRDGGRRK